MNEFMRKQGGMNSPEVTIDERVLLNAVVARLVVLQAEMSHLIAKRIEEIIVPVMVRAEERKCLQDQPLVGGDLARAHLERCLSVARNVKILRQRCVRRYIDAAVMLAGKH